MRKFVILLLIILICSILTLQAMADPGDGAEPENQTTIYSTVVTGGHTTMNVDPGDGAEPE